MSFEQKKKKKKNTSPKSNTEKNKITKTYAIRTNDRLLHSAQKDASIVEKNLLEKMAHVSINCFLSPEHQIDRTFNKKTKKKTLKRERTTSFSILLGHNMSGRLNDEVKFVLRMLKITFKRSERGWSPY